MAATVQIPSTKTPTRPSSGIPRPTSLGDGQVLMLNSGRHHQRKAAKTKHNELKLVLNLDKDGRKEEKMVKEMLKEGRDVTSPSLSVTAVGSSSTTTEGNDDIAPVRSDAHHQLVNQKHQPSMRFYKADGDRRAQSVYRNQLQREAVINAWQGEQAKLHFQNGSVGNEEFSAASVLARLGVTIDAHGSLVRERPSSLLSGGLVLNNKENVMEEPKEEDEKKTAEQSRAKNDEDNSSEEDGENGGGGDSKMTNSGTQTHQGIESTEAHNLSALYHGTWPVERTLWHSGPSSIGGTSGSKSISQDVSSVMSFTSSVGSGSGCIMPDEVSVARRTYSQQQLGAKVEMVYSLLSMLGTHDRQDMSKTLLAMSSSPDSCVAMRQSGCLPLLVQLLHGPDSDTEIRQRAAQALHNMVHSHPDDKRGRREARVLRLLEQVREYCDSLREMIDAATPAEDSQESQPPLIQAATRIDQEVLLMILRGNEKELGLAGQDSSCSLVLDDMERHPGPTIAALMKLSFDEEHRHAMCQLGGLHAVAELIQVDHEAHGSTTGDQYCVTLRRYAGMALTNLTFGDGANKALLCSFRQFMKALVAQLKSPSEDLRQVTASVLRNLSWRADGASKQTLREVGAVSGLMQAAMEGKKESTLKSILSALWNLSAHCSINKVDICAVEGALGFLVDMLSYKAPSKTLAIVENAGGILRNISSHIAVREDYRAILREHNCLQVLLQQLKSPSLTIVSNACGTLWNLSARCAEDQRALWDMGAVSMLRSLVHSKHKMISMGSSAALKNLLSAKPNNNFPPLDSTAKGLGLPALPSLYVRKQRALEQELDQTLSETCDNIEPSTSPSSSTVGLRDEKFVFSTTERCFGSTERRHSRMFHSQGHQYQHHQTSKYHSRGAVARSDSRDSVTSTLSDTVYERVSRTVINPFTFGQTSPTNENAQGLTGSLSDSGRINSQMAGGENSDRRFLRRYCNSMREREENRKVSSLDVSNEDNTQQSLSQQQHSHDYQHTRLGQISETNFPDPPESHTTTTSLSRERHISSRQSSIESPHDAKPPDERESSDDRLSTPVPLDQMMMKASASPKQPKNLLYDGSRSSSQRSAFSPLVSGSYGNTSNRPQYQHASPQQTCISSSSSPSFTTVRTKYSDFAYDDDAEAQEQPVDYSLKYVEDNTQSRDPEVNTTESNEIKSEGDRERSSPAEYQNSGSSSGIRGKQNQNDLGRGYPYRHQGNIHVSKNMKMNVVYGDYAETDLDQPTDYSLKYAEEDEETEFEKNHEMSGREQERSERNYYDGSDPIHEDTLKTYCTEGTPYETPYNFSTATSMSDLHCEPPTPHSEDNGGKKQPENFTKDESVEENAAKNLDETDVSNSEVASNFDKDFTEKGPQMKALPPAPRQPLKRLQSGLSSGLMSPEKPVQYCEEGTPGCFSRVSSLSSLNSVPTNVESVHQTPLPSNQAADDDNVASDQKKKSDSEFPATEDACSPPETHNLVVKREPDSANNAGDEAASRTEDMKEEQQRGDKEGKVVTFGGADHYAEETPLMFSRCSSLGSLSSFEQHSIHDDRSSVISDFSRRTSGIVSPSELPDSPTQTVPTSPHHTKPPVEFTSRLMEDGGTVRAQPVPANRQHVAGRSNAVKGSVFEDDVVAFKEEDTPVEFSRATSLSSLTIDDEPKISNDAMLKEVVGKPSPHPRPSNIPTGIHHTARMDLVGREGREREEGMEKQDVEKEKRGELADCCELAPVSEGEEENDEDMLAACINIGMQNSRQRQCQYNIGSANKNAQVRSNQPAASSRFQASSSQPSRSGRPSGIPVKTTPNNNLKQGKPNQPKQQEGSRGSTTKSMNYMEVPGGACEDAVRTYCTEGTPANISHAGSHSDLSVLSLPGDGDETEVRREETRLEGVEEGEEHASSGDREVERPELSDDSSNFSGDNDNILAECIQSGMPKARNQTSRRILPQPGSIAMASAPDHPSQQQKKIPTVVPGVTVSVLPPRRPAASSYRPPTHHLCSLDHGTSHSHSHSPPRPANKKPSAPPCSPRPKAPDQHPARQLKSSSQEEAGASQNMSSPKTKLNRMLHGPNMLPQCLAAKDELETYATEGSPNTFSSRSSLSDLTINSADGCAALLQRLPSGRPASEVASCDIPLRFNTEDTPLEISHAASLSSLSVGEDDDEFNAVMKTVHTSTPAGSSAHHNQGAGQTSGIPVPVSYSSEPVARTCMSPLNKAVDNVSSEAAAQLMIASDGSWGDHSDRHEDSTASSRLHNKTSSISEDIVTVLSRNGSLSSLSVDSFGSTEPTPSEQALLEQCISSGMPKSKSECPSGKARIAVPVTTKKKIGGGVCKIPLATDHRRQGDDGLVIPSVPLQKLELKPVARTHCGMYRESSSDLSLGAVASLESDLASLNLNDNINTCSYDVRQIPKNGVDPSAASHMKETAADVNENIEVIESVQNLPDHLESSNAPLENGEMIETECNRVPATISLNEAVTTDNLDTAEDNTKQDLQEAKNLLFVQKKDDARDKHLNLNEDHRNLNITLDNYRSPSEICSPNNKTDSPHGSTSDDNKSPFSSGESPSTDFGSDGRMDDCDKKKDPDAMIASLDRLTEELVQQAQDMHAQKEKNKEAGTMKQSLVGSDTWNEDTSPNDVSFPSMSISAPLVASFRSDNHEDAASTLPDLAEEDLISKTSEEQQVSSLTDSHIIEVEASKLAVAVQAEAQNLPYTSAEEMEHSLTSLNSVDLDAIKPPSMMGSLVSLTTSLSGQLDNVDSGETRERCNSSSLPPQQPRSNGTRLECRHSRKKSLPAGMMVRRALGNSNHNGSIENLQDNNSVSSSCNSHLDNIKPPSAMEELIDIVDMENSMVSVASITSEVADSSTKEQSNSEQSPGNSDAMFELLKPAAAIMAEVYAAQYPAAAMSASVRTSSASDNLDNINPPSAFNEIADLADPESTMEPGTETICSDTEMYTEEPGYAHSMEKLDEVGAPDLPSDTSRKATPIPSDHYATSSAESTPKKHKQLTPKQKRQLVKERYKTYTITAEQEREMNLKENNRSGSGLEHCEPSEPSQALQCVTSSPVENNEDLEPQMQEEDNKEVKEKSAAKVTPKQRRLEDRQRFQTRVLDKSPAVEDVTTGQIDTNTNTGVQSDESGLLEQQEPQNTDTSKQKVSRVKTLKQKRAEAKERFRTRTLSEENKPQQPCETNASEFINTSLESARCNQTNHGTEPLALNCSDVGFVEALLNVTPEEIESLLEHDANIVITTLNDSRRRNSESSELPSSDEMLLECETLSLISIESESDQNSNFCRMGKRRGSDHVGKESSVCEQHVVPNTEEVFSGSNVEEKVKEEVEVEMEDRESVDDSDDSPDEDDVPKARGPRIVKPEARLKRDTSADSNCTDDGTPPQSNSPKSIRGRRKALYSSPTVKKVSAPPPGLPAGGKARSSIPVVSGPGKTTSNSVRPTRASALRQTGRASSTGATQRSVSRTPPSSAESRSPRNVSPKTSRTTRTQQKSPANASPPAKTLARSNSAVTHTSGKTEAVENGENEVKDPRFKPPERQGTFTKEDANSSVAAKTVPPQSPTKTRIPIPASVTAANTKGETKLKKTGIAKPNFTNTTTSKTRLRKETSAPTPLTKSSAQSRFIKAHSQEINASGSPKSLVKAATIPGRNGTTRSPPLSRVGFKRGSIGAQEGMKTSLSNQSLQSNDSGKTTPKSAATHPQRSSSNCSLNSVTSGGGPTKKSVTKKEVTSKIASLWKKVEESKNKQKAKKDTRVWITPSQVEPVDAADENDGNTNSADAMPTSRLVRSSTFEGLPSKSASSEEADTKVSTDVTKVTKTKIRMRFSKISAKSEEKSSRSSGDFTGFVANPETASRLPNAQRQVAEVTGVVVVQPTSRVLDTSETLPTNKDEAPTTQEVVLRKKRTETKSENQDPDSENPKRLSRLGSFIRIDPSEEGVVSTGEGKTLSKPPASAIVQPFNYNPPTTTVGSHIPTPVTSVAKRSESYLSGIGNAEDQAEVLDEHVQEFNTASMRVTTV
ncbi:adenomatous polyposis coli protein-like isoform X2 [Periplaneta americana]|uniref:adenomatous polyposis coli protein-like isoform X2 n=1 Tax=Periplaneta americana TaxID=6978 RepID=UPI0037E8B0D8